MSLSRVATERLTFGFDYVFSKSLTSAMDFITTFNRESQLANQTTANVHDDLTGPTYFNHRHIWTLRYHYRLPFRFSNPPLAGFLQDWTLSGTSEYRTGSWFEIVTSSDAPGFGNVDGQRFDRPNILDPTILGRAIDDPDISTGLLRPELFDTRMPPGGSGNLPSRAFRADAVNNTNFSVGKGFGLSNGKPSLQVRAEFFNFFNHPLFDKPGNVFPSDIFGKIVDTQNKGRVVQLMLRMNF